jgi:hypothetical protein
MEISDQEKRNAWLSFVSAAIAASGEAIEDPKAGLEGIADDACTLADILLHAYLAKFEDEDGSDDQTPVRRKKRG